MFVSYRREDAGGHAGWLRADLSERLGKGQVFMDIDTIEPGLDFAEVIEQAVEHCDVVLVVIGPKWLSLTDSTGQRRLDDAEDTHRLEVEAALRRRIRVIPVLVQRATMPTASELPESLKTLARRHAFELDNGRWEFDVARLSAILEKDLGIAGPPSSSTDAPRDFAGVAGPGDGQGGAAPGGISGAPVAGSPAPAESDVETTPAATPQPQPKESGRGAGGWWKKPQVLIAGTLALLALVVLMALAVAPNREPERPATAGSPPTTGKPTKAEYIAQADSSCRSGLRQISPAADKVEAFPKEAERMRKRGRTEAEILARLASLAAPVERYLREQVTKLSAIPRPDGEAGAGATNWITLLERGLVPIETLVNEAEQANAAGVTSAAEDIEADSKRITSVAGRYGFKVCGDLY